MIRDIESPHVARDVARRVKRGRRALVVKSMKCPGGDLRVESSLERDVATLLDLDPRVVELTSQPFSIEIESCLILTSRDHYVRKPGIKPRFYTPDFLCRLGDGSKLAIDAKHSSFIAGFEPKQAEIVSGLWQHGIRFLLIPETLLFPEQMRIAASLHLLRAKYQQPLRDQADNELRVLLEKQSSWLTSDLSSLLTSGQVGILAGLLSGSLKADLSSAVFASHSRVDSAHGDLSHLQLLELSA